MMPIKKKYFADTFLLTLIYWLSWKSQNTVSVVSKPMVIFKITVLKNAVLSVKAKYPEP
jgi:hypothetical protein